jgi:hypothetical protein
MAESRRHSKRGALTMKLSTANYLATGPVRTQPDTVRLREHQVNSRLAVGAD